jgi:hypothetical protein
MAKRTTGDLTLEDLAGSTSQPVEDTPSPEPIAEAPPRGPVPGEVYVLNKTSAPLDITLVDGRNLRVGPYTRGGGHNKSDIIPKKLLPPYVKRLEAQGSIRIIDAAAEGGN